MKKLIIVIAALFALSAVALAQPRAIGIRVGHGAEVSYQHSLGNNFLEADLGWNFLSGGGFNLTGIYDFTCVEDCFGVTELDFYAGPGATIGFWGSDFHLGIAGQAGLDYTFKIPLSISLDWRPAFMFVPGTAFHAASFALGVRYRF